MCNCCVFFWFVLNFCCKFKLPGVKAQGKSATSGTTEGASARLFFFVFFFLKMRATGTRGLKQTGVRDLTYRLCFLASTVRLADLRSGSINLKEDQEDNVVEGLFCGFLFFVFVFVFLMLICRADRRGEERHLSNVSAQNNLWCENVCFFKFVFYEKKGDLAKSVAPTVFGHDEIKRGLLLMMMGGVHKVFLCLFVCFFFFFFFSPSFARKQWKESI